MECLVRKAEQRWCWKTIRNTKTAKRLRQGRL